MGTVPSPNTCSPLPSPAGTATGAADHIPNAQVCRNRAMQPARCMAAVRPAAAGTRPPYPSAAEGRVTAVRPCPARTVARRPRWCAGTAPCNLPVAWRRSGRPLQAPALHTRQRPRAGSLPCVPAPHEQWPDDLGGVPEPRHATCPLHGGGPAGRCRHPPSIPISGRGPGHCRASLPRTNSGPTTSVGAARAVSGRACSGYRVWKDRL